MPVVPANPPAPAILACLDVISSALRLIGVLASGETADAATANDSLMVLQAMWDSWNAEKLMIFTIPRNVYSLTVGQQAYTIGIDPTGLTTANFSVPRPPAIDRMGIINLNNAEQPLELPLQYLTVAQWQEIPVKNIESALPQYCWDDNGYPFRTWNFWPIPNVNVQIAVYPWAALTTPGALTTQMLFPPGYLQAFRYNLAVLLAAEFPPVDAQVLQTVMAIALQSKGVVKSLNIQPIDLRCDPAILPMAGQELYNWISDMPAGR